MGEIGLPRREFLYAISFWEARRILRGYNKRERGMWSVTRWQTFNLMAAFCGSEGLSKSGIHKPTDLIIFPWEKEPTAPLSDVEVAEMQAEMAALNALNKAKP